MFVHCLFNLDDEKMIGVRISLLSRSILQEDEKDAREMIDLSLVVLFLQIGDLALSFPLAWTIYLSLFNQ